MCKKYQITIGSEQIYQLMFQIEFDTKEIESALPEYKYVKRLGCGAFAVVHLVENRSTSEQLALKKVNCFGMAEYDKEGVANQVKILKALNHKNIIKVKSSQLDSSEEIMYIFMEYAESGDLTNLIEQAKQKKKRIQQSTIWKILHDVSEGLLYLHQNKIVHRDIKPANIFKKDRLYKIGDMNISKIIKNGDAASTKTGSPLYSAPEVWNSEFYDEKCDIWSLGVLAYQLCALRVPFEADTIMELLKKTKQQKPPNLPTFYSRTLDQLVRKMLEYSVKKRITLEYIIKLAKQKLRVESEIGEEQNMVGSIVFPDSHQRWLNLVAPQLPPKTARRESFKTDQQRSKSKERIKEISRERLKSKEKEKQKQKEKERQMQKNEEIQLLLNTGVGFRPIEQKPLIIPKSSSRGKAEVKVQQKPMKQVPLPNNLPPIYRANSPVCQRKKGTQKEKSGEKKQRELSKSRSKRQSAIELVIQSKSIMSSE